MKSPIELIAHVVTVVVCLATPAIINPELASLLLVSVSFVLIIRAI